MSKKKSDDALPRWIVQTTLPWMSDFKNDAEWAARTRRADRFCKMLAEAVAIFKLKELGKEAKTRMTCPETGEYVAFILDPSTSDIRRFQGRESK